MTYLLVLNDSPYGSQRTYNALRLAGVLAKTTTSSDVAIFLLGDGVVSGLRRESPADASYNVQEMLRLLTAQGMSIGAWRDWAYTSRCWIPLQRCWISRSARHRKLALTG